MRILTTGSREWWDVPLINSVLDEYSECCDVTLISGDCPKGADVACVNYAYYAGWTVELHPADWIHYGKSAGFVRNSHMVKLGADVCVAFIRNSSKGASMTAKLAIDKGIETRIFRMEEF